MMLDELPLADTPTKNVTGIITIRMLRIQDDATDRLVFTRLNGGHPVFQTDCKLATRNTT